MRFIISSAPAPDKNLIGLTAIVKRWFVEKEGIASFKEGALIEQTDKAMLFCFKSGQEHWIPKSLILLRRRDEVSLTAFLC